MPNCPMPGGVPTECLPRRLHIETVVVDGTWATVGAATLDDRSLFMNHEINLMSRDPLLCRRLEAPFLVDLEKAEPIMGRQWARHLWSRHVVEVIGRPARCGP